MKYTKNHIYAILENNRLVTAIINDKSIENYPDEQVIDITDITPQPQLHWSYVDGKFIDFASEQQKWIEADKQKQQEEAELARKQAIRDKAHILLRKTHHLELDSHSDIMTSEQYDTFLEWRKKLVNIAYCNAEIDDKITLDMPPHLKSLME